MSPENELVERLVRADPVPVALIENIDVFALAELGGLTLLGQHADESAAKAIHRDHEMTVLNDTPGQPARADATVAPATFLRSVAAQDPEAVTLADGVDPVGLAFLCLVCAAWPATRDPIAWCDSFLFASITQGEL